MKICIHAFIVLSDAAENGSTSATFHLVISVVITQIFYQKKSLRYFLKIVVSSPAQKLGNFSKIAACFLLKYAVHLMDYVVLALVAMNQEAVASTAVLLKDVLKEHLNYYMIVAKIIVAE